LKFALADDNLPIQFCEGEGSRPDKSNGPLSASPSLILPCIKPHFQPYGIIHFRLLLEKSFSRQGQGTTGKNRIVSTIGLQYYVKHKRKPTDGGNYETSTFTFDLVVIGSIGFGKLFTTCGLHVGNR
jgi:hypothetical protein